MRAFLIFVVGVVAGAALLAAVQIFVAPVPLIAPGSSGQGDVTIIFRNEFLTRELRAEAANFNSPIPIEGLSVTTTTDNLIIQGTAAVPGLSARPPVQVTLRPVVVQNRVAVQLVKADVGRLTIPGQFLPLLEGRINQELQRALGSASFRILRVTTTTEGVVVDVSLEGAIGP